MARELDIDEASTGFELLMLLARPGGHYDEAGRLQAMLLEKTLDMDELRNAVVDLVDPTQIVS